VVGYTQFSSFEFPLRRVPGVMRSGRETDANSIIIFSNSFIFIENRATPCSNLVVGYTTFLSLERPIHRVPAVMRSVRESVIKFP
jgi:hypothetical protein